MSSHFFSYFQKEMNKRKKKKNKEREKENVKKKGPGPSHDDQEDKGFQPIPKEVSFFLSP